MWRAVINNALGDVTINSSDRKSSLYKFAVHDWIIQNSDDFQQVCYYAELDPENIRRQYMRAIKLKKILFTDRQLKWKKYNDNYQKLKTIKCREERKKLRKIVEYLRQLVFKSTNKIIEI